MSPLSRFFVGLLMFSVGIYILLKSIQVSNSFSMSYRFGYGNVGVPASVLFLGFILGMGMLFFNAKSPIGWIITALSVGFLIVGVIMNLHVSLTSMNAFNFLSILALLAGGGGLLLSSIQKKNRTSKTF